MRSAVRYFYKLNTVASLIGLTGFPKSAYSIYDESTFLSHNVSTRATEITYDDLDQSPVWEHHYHS
jgi:hypothetical protein